MSREASSGAEADEAARGEHEAARASWGYPAFARDFPRHAELDALVAAFTRGDYRTVRERAPKLATAPDEPEAVRRAAAVLRARIDPDPTARVFFALTAALLVFLTAWWITHDGKHRESAPEPPRKIEYVK